MALVEVKQLTKSFGNVQAVKAVSFAVHSGRCAALLGPNGAGKTTTLRMLAGLLKPTSGEIQIPGIAPGGDMRSLIGYLPQSPSFYGWMNGREFLAHAAALHGLPSKEARQRSDELLEITGIASAATRRIAGYSGGMKQRLGIAQALIHRPALLILDEPVSALDPIGRKEVMQLLTQLKSQMTILFSTHVLHDAGQLCDDAIIIHQGKVAAQGALEQLRAVYQRPVIEIHFSPQGENWLREWAHKQPYVKHAAVADGVARLEVDDVDKARAQVLLALGGSGIHVERVDFGGASLEDLFMKVVEA